MSQIVTLNKEFYQKQCKLINSTYLQKLLILPWLTEANEAFADPEQDTKIAISRGMPSMTSRSISKLSGHTKLSNFWKELILNNSKTILGKLYNLCKRNFYSSRTNYLCLDLITQKQNLFNETGEEVFSFAKLNI